MTQEGQGPSPDETSPPPTSTRWSEDPVDEEAEIAPPFVAGRSSPQQPESPVKGEEPLFVDEAAVPAEPDWSGGSDLDVPDWEGQPSAQEPETVEREPGEAAIDPEELAAGSGMPTAAEAEQDFPFDQFGGAEPETAEPDVGTPEGDQEEQAEEAPGASGGWSPFEAYDELSATTGSEGATEATEQEEPDPWAEPEGTVEPQAEAIPLPPVPAEAEELEERAEADPAEEMATLLERMARTLRDEGPDAVRAEMDAPDRMTSVLAGLVSGWLSGHE